MAEASHCPAQLRGEITAPLTIGAECAPVEIDGAVVVSTTLVLEAGARLLAKPESSLTIGLHQPGTLIVRGTDQTPVIVSAGEGARTGSWGGIQLGASAAGSSLAGLVVEHAGWNEQPAIAISAVDVRLVGVQVRSVRATALALQVDAPVHVEGLRVEGAGKPAVTTTALAAGGIGPIAGREVAVHVTSGMFSDTTTLAKIDVPWVITYDAMVENSDGVAATLTLAAGADLSFTEQGALTVGYYHPGTLEVAGTAELPVRLASAREPSAGAWRGVLVAGFGSATLEHVQIAHAGRDEGAALAVHASGSLRATDVAIASSRVGVSAPDDGATLSIARTSFHDVATPAELIPVQLAGLGKDNRYEGSGPIAVREGSVRRDATWIGQACPIEIHGEVSVDGGATLKIEGGRYEFREGVKFTVGYYEGGRVEITGALEQPVALVGAGGGSWGPLSLHSASRGSVLRHVRIERGGPTASIVVEGQATATLEDVTCDACPGATVTWSCESHVTRTDVRAGEGTRTAEAAPSGCP